MKKLMKIGALALATTFGIVGCSSSPKAVATGADPAMRDLAIDGPSETLRQGQEKGLSTSNMNYEAARKVEEVGKRLARQQNELRSALENGEWETVLELAQSLEAQWASAGVNNSVYYSWYKAEALIGLGRPEEALALLDPDPKHRDTAASLTHALALAMTDQLDAQAARYIAEAPIRRGSDMTPQTVPACNTRNQRIATVRTARAIDANSSAQDKVALREAREALRLDPNQRLAAYVLAEVAGRLGLKAEALANWRIALTLPGRYGEKAKEMVESYEASLKPMQIGPYTNPPDGSG